MAPRKKVPSRAKRRSDRTKARASRDPLRTYREKRDFAVTREPKGARAAKRAAKAHGFVVQKHAARRLHYDFRLEHEGVLWSWAVPKGPSLDPKERRLAARTEDHPIEYAGFEGVIPAGEYGAGAVIVWDRGTWTPEGDAAAGMKKGHLAFELQGDKLRGRFHLVRLRTDEKGKENWLLFKSKDEAAQAGGEIVEARPESVTSGRTIEEVDAAPERVWHSHRPAKVAAKRVTAPKRVARANRSAISRPASRGRRAATPERDDDAEITAAVRALPLGFGLSNLDKMLFPDSGLRKVHLLAYYASIAPTLLPHVARRPLTLVRCPEGSTKKCFYQKHAKDSVPDAIRRVPIVEGGREQPYMFIEDLPGLVALGQMGVLEVHSWMSHVDDVERPDQIVLDIDPDEALPFDAVVETALLLRERLSSLGLTSFVKTTGGKGLHVALPVGRKLDWETHKEFTHALVRGIAKDHAGRFVTTVRKDARKGKLFLDYLRNGRGASAVVPYSPRARPGAPVATPLAWEELERPIDPSRFTFSAVLERVARESDPWKAFASVRQSITKKMIAAVG